VFEWFRLSNAAEKVPVDFSDQFDNSQRLFAVFFNPPGQVLKGCGVKFQVF
jgi:hypothetical protein